MTGLLPAVLLIPALRGVIFLHSVPSDTPWRHFCPKCYMSIRLIGPRGRCPHCQVAISPFPYSVELLALAVLALLAWRISDPLALAAVAWISIVGIALVCIDVAVHRLPDRLTFLAFGGGLLILAFGDMSRIGRALLCCLALASAYLLMSVVAPNGMGLGDGKFALSLGLVLGWYGWGPTLYGAALGFVFSGLFAIGMLLARRVTMKGAIPHGPFMLLGTLVTVLMAS